MPTPTDPPLAAYRHFIERLRQSWPAFLAKRADRLRHGAEREKVAEAIIEDLFTDVLDWSEGDVSYQVDFADIVLTHNLAKYMVIEVKRPGTLFPRRMALEKALIQARGYADKQKIEKIAATDGRFLYAADIVAGGLVDRVMVELSTTHPPEELWNVSLHGIYRPVMRCGSTIEIAETEADFSEPSTEARLHPKYKLPAACFAYAPDTNRPASWKLPYRLADGRVDPRRLPKAIQALLTSYRGAKVSGIPQSDLPMVLMRLARAAHAEGRMPPQSHAPAPAYQQLAQVLEQQGLLAELTRR